MLFYGNYTFFLLKKKEDISKTQEEDKRTVPLSFSFVFPGDNVVALGDRGTVLLSSSWYLIL